MTFFADLHVHPFLCPYQQRKNENDLLSRNPNDETSVWHNFRKSSNFIRNLGEKFGFTTYSQADFLQSALYNVRLINAAVYPPERSFFQLSKKTLLVRILIWLGLDRFVETELGHIVSGFSRKNIRHIKSERYEYFTEMLHQLNFISATTPFTPDTCQRMGTIYNNIKNARYVLLKRGCQVTSPATGPIIQVVLSVEGGNAFWGNFKDAHGRLWNGTNFSNYMSHEQLCHYQAFNAPDFRNAITKNMIENSPDSLNSLIPQEICDALLQNVNTLLQQKKLFSYTFSHHFYNGLCGHCASLQPLTNLKLVDQSFGMSTDITHLGYMVLNKLLANNIIIDTKHMSWRARQSYYRFRKNNYPRIPIISSHSAVAGVKVIGDSATDKHFYNVELNLCDEDIAEIISSKGLIGISMDQRVTGVQQGNPPEGLWHQFKYIAEKAASGIRNDGQTVWDNMCIGSDFDGVIHPIHNFKKYELFKALGEFLLQRIEEYIANPPSNFLPQDKLQPQQILSKICYRNMCEVIKKNYP